MATGNPGELDLARLRAAAEEASWLTARGYPAAAVASFVASHRGLGTEESALLDASARADAHHRHHIARELDPEDVERRPVRVDVASLVETVATALHVARGGRGHLLESSAGVVVVAARPSPLAPDLVTEALARVAAALLALRPSAFRVVHDAETEPLAQALRTRLALRPKVRVDLECATSVTERLAGAVHVVSSTPAVLDRCGTWLNLAAPIVRALEVAPLRLA